MAAKKQNKKEEIKEEKLELKAQDSKTLEAETPKQEVKKSKPAPTHYFIKKNYPHGVQIGNLLVPYRAGQKIDDLGLCYELRQLGVELVETLQECDLFGLE